MAAGGAQAAVEALQRLGSKASASRMLRQEAVLEACAAAAGVSAMAVEEALGASPERLLAAERILGAAANTVWMRKLAVLGQALGDVVRFGGDGHLAQQLVEAAAVAAVEEPHVAVLHFAAQRREPEEPDGFTGWSDAHLIDALPSLAPVLDPLLSTLSLHGLIYDAADGSWAGASGQRSWVASDFGRRLLNVFVDAAETMSEVPGEQQ